MKLPPNFVNCVQHSEEWFEVRLGCVTSSRVADATRKLKNGKYSKERENYKYEKLTEILTGRIPAHYVSKAMDFGVINEPLGRAAYEVGREADVELVGFAKHPSIARSGASPDGLVNSDGLIEIKVPNTTTHLEYLLAGTVPDEYRSQMLWQMACTGRKYCDFVSYDPRLPSEFGLFIVRFDRDDKLIAEMEREVMKFLAELDVMVETLRERKSLINPDLTEALRGSLPKAEIPTWQSLTIPTT